MITIKSFGKAVLGLSLMVALAACVAQPVQECEPGVGEISEMGTVMTYPGC
ncbi:hypothetical protein [Rhodovulum euryhalinum]|uniref:Lipoprotein n=1 Tax=Rhodovulum euryhalinum TaxID=35805 RepID=A0A4R2KH33_9RHOB|nr:hypothetical protein [Rhodovulum euryhalinum]TCO73101.1 hypothetical protein EV655_103331 [Rhodovulum euryhalinum]